MNLGQTAAGQAPRVLSILRIVAALLFLEHGTSRLFGWPSPLPQPAVFTMYWFAGAIEFVGGILVALGLYTRGAAFVMSGQMAFAYFISHAPRAFFPILNRGDS
jgi:putative oxidoreductase